VERAYFCFNLANLCHQDDFTSLPVFHRRLVALRFISFPDFADDVGPFCDGHWAKGCLVGRFKFLLFAVSPAPPVF